MYKKLVCIGNVRTLIIENKVVQTPINLHCAIIITSHNEVLMLTFSQMHVN